MYFKDIKTMINTKEAKDLFEKLYGKELMYDNKKRYELIIDGYTSTYGVEPQYLFSSPGRTEISGNHTDHNHGKVIGASINLDCLAAVNENSSNKINILSESFNQRFTIDIDNLSPSEKKAGTIDLVKGILKGFLEKGYKIGGFDAYITSNVIASAGVSSSAAFETLLCQIINTLFNEDKIDIVTYAHIGKYAENNYWDKASGLLDQMCCAVGGLINIDFLDAKNPKVKKIDFDFSKENHSIIIVQTGKGHADLSEEYSSIPNEMKKVAQFFGKEVLADINEQDLYTNLTKLRGYAGDRAVLRAIHFFDENKRVDDEVAALETKNFKGFLDNITSSGNSSWKYLQNSYTNKDVKEQSVNIALALTERFISKKQVGACRIHGGGFAGVIMAILPNEIVKEYITYIEEYMGKDSAYKMSIRPYGSICINNMIGAKHEK